MTQVSFLDESVPCTGERVRTFPNPGPAFNPGLSVGHRSKPQGCMQAVDYELQLAPRAAKRHAQRQWRLSASLDYSSVMPLRECLDVECVHVWCRMANMHNMKSLAPGAGSVQLFAKGSDGTADFGVRYNPLTGTAVHSQSAKPAQLTDTSFVPYSENLAQTKADELKEHTTHIGRSTCSYRDWDTQRCVPPGRKACQGSLYLRTPWHCNDSKPTQCGSKHVMHRLAAHQSYRHLATEGMTLIPTTINNLTNPGRQHVSLLRIQAAQRCAGPKMHDWLRRQLSGTRSQ